MTHYEKYGKKSYEKHKERILQQQRGRYVENKEAKQRYYYKKRRGWMLKCRYGLSEGDYESMLKQQNGKCAVCGTDKPGDKDEYFHIDHDHVTGKVRGLLCNRCNLGLGFFLDNSSNLRAAAEYLDKGGVCGL